jgi:rSAM/selenodomain-associated transferase 1
MHPGNLIIFTRYPVPGKAKTRLIPTLGAVGAARLMQRLTLQTLQMAKTFAADHGIQLLVYLTDGTPAAMARLYGPHFLYRLQSQGDLGQRLHLAFQDVWAAAPAPTVVIGCDCPDLTGAHLAAAFQHLTTHDLVLGPAHDGGYYLLGLKAPYPELFQDIAWGTAQVLAQTLAKAEALGLTTALLPTLRDLDRPEDLILASAIPV